MKLLIENQCLCTFLGISLYTVLFYINVRISLILSDLTFNFAICYEI